MPSASLRRVAGPPQFQAPTGTHDVMPPTSARWGALVAQFAKQAQRAGYGLLQSPLFESAEVFRPMGSGTDVVRKEMYEFQDKGGHHVALRPEGTASVVRAYVQHSPSTPWKVWYAAPSFRYERPQRGRFRQHHQLGVEALGSPDPDLDVEVITLLWDFLATLGLGDLTLKVNSMGDIETRPRYLAELRSYLHDRIGDLAPADRDKVVEFPMRVLDSKHLESQEVTAQAPTLLDTLSPDAERRFERVQSGLRAVGVPFRIDPRLVRGLDYYTHTTFEVVSDALDAAQSTIGGGGRYDGLVEALGGPPTPGVGFGCGIERTLLACDHEGVFPVPDPHVDVFVVDVTGGDSARDLVAEMRRSGLAADRAWDGRSMKAQMKLADRSGARAAVIIGAEELESGTVGLRWLREERNQVQLERRDLATQIKHLLDTGTTDGI